MKGSMESPRNGQEVRTMRAKFKVIKEPAMAKGLEALAALETSDIAIKPVQATARTFVQTAIESIMRLRAKGVPLLRIYNDSRKAAGLRISYQTFAGYVSEISREKGLRLARTKTEAAPAARPRPEREPAPMVAEASPLDGLTASMDAGPAPVSMTDAGPAPATATAPVAAMTETAGMDGWCDRCATDAERMTRDDGRAWWQCRSCRSLWADQDGVLTHKRLAIKKAV